jgi:tetraacyldisaccharide 4'-kinase
VNNSALHALSRFASRLYCRGAMVRNECFERGIFAQTHASVPVISIGNCSVGGTGKTPFVQALVRLLGEEFPAVRPAIVLRGYGRTSCGNIIVSNGAQILVSDPARVGDEALFHAESLPTIPVIVDEKRSRGARTAIEQCGATCIILDDGFQHRSLHRNCDIVLLDHATLAHPYCLPHGRLRESLQSLHRADVVCWMNDAKPDNNLHSIYSHINIAATVLEASIDAESMNIITSPEQIGVSVLPQPLVIGSTDTLVCATERPNTSIQECTKKSLPNNLLQTPICAVAGIANPERFYTSLQRLGVNIASTLTFRDHVRYGKRELRQILDEMRLHHATILVTTEKDLVKLRVFCNIFAQHSITLATLPVRCSIHSGKEALVQRLSALF